VLRRAAQQAAADAGVPAARHADIALAISEAASNAILHAYSGRDAGEIRLSARRDGDHFEIAVSDDGAGLRPRPDSPGMGIGLPMIAELAHSIDVAADAGTTITMRFTLDD